MSFVTSNFFSYLPVAMATTSARLPLLGPRGFLFLFSAQCRRAAENRRARRVFFISPAAALLKFSSPVSAVLAGLSRGGVRPLAALVRVLVSSRGGGYGI